MTRIKILSPALSIWVFGRDHAPPHFHVMSPETDVLIDMRSFEIIRGTYKRKDLAAALEWASEPENLALMRAEWRRLNEQD